MAATLVDSSTFMDDLAAGAEDTNGAFTIYQFAALMLKISLRMQNGHPTRNTSGIRGPSGKFPNISRKNFSVLTSTYSALSL